MRKFALIAAAAAISAASALTVSATSALAAPVDVHAGAKTSYFCHIDIDTLRCRPPSRA